MLEKPVVKLLTVICLGPGIVASFRVNRQFCVLVSGFLERVEHVFALLQRNDSVLRAVKCPNRQALEGSLFSGCYQEHIQNASPATNRSNCREAFRVL